MKRFLIIVLFSAFMSIAASADIRSYINSNDSDTIPELEYIEVDSNFEFDVKACINWYWGWLKVIEDIPQNNPYFEILDSEDEYSKEYIDLARYYYNNNFECLPFARDYCGAIDSAKHFVYSIICADYHTAIDTSIYPNYFANIWETFFEKYGGKRNAFSNGHDIIDMRKIISEGYYPIIKGCNRLDLGKEDLNDQYYGFNIRFECYNKDGKRYNGDYDDTVRIMVAQNKLPNAMTKEPEFYIIGYK